MVSNRVFRIYRLMGPMNRGHLLTGCLRDYEMARHLVEEDRLVADKTGLLEFHCPGHMAMQHGFHPLARLFASFRQVPCRNRAELSLLGGHATISGSCTMKSILMTLVIACMSTSACVSTSAMAQSGSTTLTMTCAQARGIVSSQGSVVLHTGPNTFDRYVRDGSFCALQEVARPTWVRTSDSAQCPIGGVCRSVEIDNGR
jgi:hypothetical protein